MDNVSEGAHCRIFSVAASNMYFLDEWMNRFKFLEQVHSIFSNYKPCIDRTYISDVSVEMHFNRLTDFGF